MPEPTDASEVSLPSESYLNKNESVAFSQLRLKEKINYPIKSYQDLNFVASGKSGFTTTLLLLNADKDTPETQ